MTQIIALPTYVSEEIDKRVDEFCAESCDTNKEQLRRDMVDGFVMYGRIPTIHPADIIECAGCGKCVDKENGHQVDHQVDGKWYCEDCPEEE